MRAIIVILTVSLAGCASTFFRTMGEPAPAHTPPIVTDGGKPLYTDPGF